MHYYQVIHHLYHSAKAMNTLHDPLATPSGGGASPRSLPHSSFSPSAQQPATLFRNASTREEVAVQVGVVTKGCGCGLYKVYEHFL